ncbi:MAG: class IV adenylate cyclase [bacterium]
MENTEIEKRFSVKNKSSLLKKLGHLGKEIFANHQVDTYYSPSHRNFLDEKHPFEWLRLRDDQGKYVFTYKHWYPERVKESTHCDEYESKIENIESFRKILKALDFEEVVVVDKKRTAYTIKNLEVAVDDVKDLGMFLEIEIKDHYESVEDGIEQIYALAKKLGLEQLPEDHPVRTGGYALQLYLKNKKVIGRV